MYTSHEPSKMSIHSLINILILISVLMPSSRRIFASEKAPNKPGAMLLVLEDCDSDNKLSTEPYGDTATLLDSKGYLVRKLYGLGIKSTVCGSRNISASEDGRFFVMYENVPGKLTLYETATLKQLWSLWVDCNSAVFANGLIYAVNNYNVFAIDKAGTIVKHARLGGLDIALDTKHDCIWIVGNDIKKCNLDFQLNFKTKLTLDASKSCSSSVDFNAIGSVWIAERNVDCKNGSKNRLVKRSLYGSILKIVELDFSPIRVRIDRSNGSVWATGITKERDFSGIGDEWPETLDELNNLVKTKVETFTCKYDSNGG
jgi:hypothetical protein